MQKIATISDNNDNIDHNALPWGENTRGGKSEAKFPVLSKSYST